MRILRRARCDPRLAAADPSRSSGPRHRLCSRSPRRAEDTRVRRTRAYWRGERTGPPRSAACLHNSTTPHRSTTLLSASKRLSRRLPEDSSVGLGQHDRVLQPDLIDRPDGPLPPRCHLDSLSRPAAGSRKRPNINTTFLRFLGHLCVEGDSTVTPQGSCHTALEHARRDAPCHAARKPFRRSCTIRQITPACERLACVVPSPGATLRSTFCRPWTTSPGP